MTAKSLILLVVVIIALIISALWITRSNNSDSTSDKPKQPMPDFSLKNYDGEFISSEDFVGQPLVINSWAVWCPFCKDELPDFVASQQEFGDQVTIIAIDRAETKKVAQKFTDSAGISDKLVFLLDPSDSFYRDIGGFSMPETIFVDRQGNIQFHKRGPMTREEINQKITELISL